MVGIDYEVEEGKDYVILITNTKGNEKKEIINFTKPIEPTISSIDMGYLTLTSTGVEKPKTIEITYDERSEFENYYSIDNGKTWNLYAEPISAIEGKVMAKSIHKRCNEIYTMSERNIEKPLDALGYEAFDDDENNYSRHDYKSGYKCKLYIDESCWGRYLYIDYMILAGGAYVRDNKIYFYANDDSVIDSFTNEVLTTDVRRLIWQEIPKQTSYIIITQDLPIQVYSVYTDKKAVLPFPILTSDGVKNVGIIEEDGIHYELDLSAGDSWIYRAARKCWFDNDFTPVKVTWSPGKHRGAGVFKVHPSAIGTTWKHEVTNHNPYIITYNANEGTTSGAYRNSIVITEDMKYISFISGSGNDVWIKEMYQVK